MLKTGRTRTSTSIPCKNAYLAKNENIETWVSSSGTGERLCRGVHSLITIIEENIE